MEKALKKAFEMYPDTALDTVYGYQISKGKRDAFMNGVKWRESQNSSTSDEALPIADVVGQSEQLADKGRYCKDCGDYVGKGCDNSDCKDFKG